MKNIFILILFISNFSNAQSLVETISLLNKVINQNHFATIDKFRKEDLKRVAVVDDVTKALVKPIRLWKINYLVSVNSKGKLIIDCKSEKYLTPIGTKYPDWLNIQPQKTGIVENTKNCYREVYLKALKNSYRLNDNSPDWAYVTFDCKNDEKNVTFKYDVDNGKITKSNFISLDLNNVDSATTVAKAILHLMEIANSNKDFLEGDD